MGEGVIANLPEPRESPLKREGGKKERKRFSQTLATLGDIEELMRSLSARINSLDFAGTMGQAVPPPSLVPLM